MRTPVESSWTAPLPRSTAGLLRRCCNSCWGQQRRGGQSRPPCVPPAPQAGGSSGSSHQSDMPCFRRLSRSACNSVLSRRHEHREAAGATRIRSRLFALLGRTLPGRDADRSGLPHTDPTSPCRSARTQPTRRAALTQHLSCHRAATAIRFEGIAAPERDEPVADVRNYSRQFPNQAHNWAGMVNGPLTRHRLRRSLSGL
jgi:hypothetical protein